MTFPVDADRAIFRSPSFNTSHAVTLPGSISAGNLLVMWVATSSSGVNLPSGWSQALVIDTNPDAFGPNTLNFTAKVFYRIADGSEGATQTVTTGASIGIATVTWRITGHDPDYPPEFIWSSGNAAPANPPDFDPYGWEGPLDVLWLAGGGRDGGGTMTGTPTNYSNVVGGTGSGSSIATRGGSRQLNAVTEDPPAFSDTGAVQVVGVTIAIKPVDDDVVDHSPTDYGSGPGWHTNANANTHVVRLPSDYAAGERGIIGITFDGNAGAPTVTTPTGWTALSGSPVTNGRTRSYYWWRDLDGSEGASVSITTSGGGVGGVSSAGWAKRVRGFDAATPPEFTSATGTSTTPDPPSHSTSWAATNPSLFIASVGQFVGTSPFAITGTPTNYEKPTNASAARNVSNAQAMRAVSRELTAASENPAAFASSVNQPWVAVTIAVKGGTGGVPPSFTSVSIDA